MQSNIFNIDNIYPTIMNTNCQTQEKKMLTLCSIKLKVVFVGDYWIVLCRTFLKSELNPKRYNKWSLNSAYLLTPKDDLGLVQGIGKAALREGLRSLWLETNDKTEFNCQCQLRRIDGRMSCADMHLTSGHGFGTDNEIIRAAIRTSWLFSDCIEFLVCQKPHQHLPFA